MRRPYGVTMAATGTVSARRAYVEGRFTPAAVRFEDGVITEVGPFDPDADTVLAEDAMLLPGLVDSHVHLNEPGRAEWEGFATGTAAAAAGGVTTVVDMPLNSIPVTTSPEALAAKRMAARGKLAVDLAYWGGAIPDNLGTLARLARAGVVGFKAFLAPSGIDEFPPLDSDGLIAAMAELAVSGAGALVVHAEDPARLHPDGPLGIRYRDFLAARPDDSETAAVATVIDAARRTGARAHIVHLSAAAALPLVRAAKADGVRLTVETCPHYLALDAAGVPDAAPVYKCCPPIRDRVNQDALWEGVLDGTIDAIVSDHSPAPDEMKRRGDGDWGLAWGGVAGLQTGLAVVATAARERGVPLAALLPLMTEGPARIAGLDRLGALRPGSPAHLVDFRPDQTVRLAEADLAYRHPLSPWLGRELTGVVAATYLRGTMVYRRGDGVLTRAGREVLPAPAGAR